MLVYFKSSVCPIRLSKAVSPLLALVFVFSGCAAAGSSADSSSGDRSTPSQDSLVVSQTPVGIDSLVMETDSTRPENQKVIGYYAWWTRGAWINLNLSQYDKLIFFTTTVSSDGEIKERNGWPHAWGGFLDKADSAGVAVVPTMALLDASAIRTLFMSDEAIERLVSSALTLIGESGGTGLHLDIEFFETAGDTLSRRFMAFTDSLAAASLSKYPEAELSIFAPAFDAGGLYDIATLSDRYKEIMVQGYDLHWQNGPTAGPLSPLSGWGDENWQEIATRYSNAGIESSRIIMTIPYYGYEWPVESDERGAKTRSTGRIVTFAPVDSLNLPDIQVSVEERIAQHGMKRDMDSGSPYYSFQDSTGWWQGWYEDQTSLEVKYEFIKRHEMSGIAIFPIGYDAGKLDYLIVDHFGSR